MPSFHERFAPGTFAVLVLDYEPAILDRLPGASDLIGHTNSVLETARSHGGIVCLVRVAFDPAEYDDVPPTNQAFSVMASDRAYPADDAATAIHPLITRRDDDLEFRKTRVSAFSTTDLDSRLVQLGVNTLFLAGVHTSGAVLSTFCAAADRDYRLFIMADCTADPDEEAHHVLTTRVFPRQATVLDGNAATRLIART